MKLFYNFCLKDDDTDLDSDILSGVRRSYFDGFQKIKDKITINSDADPSRDTGAVSYEYVIEKDKPMRWEVRSLDGAVLQDVTPSDNRKYYIYFYRDEALYKRILFSHLHTLLRVEYFDVPTGLQILSLEPRKAHDGLCILLDSRTTPQPVVLYPGPEVSDDRLRGRVEEGFSDYTVRASTDDGIVFFLTEEQQKALGDFIEQAKSELAEDTEESFIGEDTPLFDRIKVTDFNVKRNLATSLDITKAAEFRFQAEESSSAEEVPAEDQTDSPSAAADDTADTSVSASPEGADDADAPAPAAAAAIGVTSAASEPVPASEEDISAATETDSAIADGAPAEEPAHGIAPDKLIMADGAMYSYYGELDANGNRSGYGRTLTDDGRTAYEGGYVNDKRTGIGSYFYKDGSLCYAGEWAENVRHGVGVGISSGDGSIHVGRWALNKPVGSGVRLTAGGDIKFVCHELSDGTTVLMNTMPDDRVLIAKYDQNGKKLGEKTVSLTDILN